MPAIGADPTGNVGGGIVDGERIAAAVGARMPRVAVGKVLDGAAAGVEQADFLAVVVEGIAVGAKDVDAAAVAIGEGGGILHQHAGCAGSKRAGGKVEGDASAKVDAGEIERGGAGVFELDELVVVGREIYAAAGRVIIDLGDAKRRRCGNRALYDGVEGGTPDDVGARGAGLVNFDGQDIVTLREIGQRDGERTLVHGIAHTSATVGGAGVGCVGNCSGWHPQAEDLLTVQIDDCAIIQN